jgi:hypothetical protein
VNDQQINEFLGQVDVPFPIAPLRKASTHFSWHTVDGSAVAGLDYVGGSGTDDRMASLLIIYDEVAEGPETFFVDITDLSTLIPNKTRVTITIVDTQSLPRISIEDMTVLEGAAGTRTTVRLPVRLSVPAPVPVAFEIELSGTADSTDGFLATPRKMVIPRGASRVDLEVTIVGDDVDEPDEDFRVRIVLPHFAVVDDGRSSLSIIDDDPGTVPYVSVYNVRVGETTGADTLATFAVQLAAPQPQEVRVQWYTFDVSANAGPDYDLGFGTLVFPPGEVTKSIDVTVHGDGIAERLEKFALTLWQPSGVVLGRSKAEGAIVDDDTAFPDVTLDAVTVAVSDVRIAEGSGGSTDAVFTLTLDEASPATVQISVATESQSATAGSDYEPRSAIVTFSPGQTTGTFVVRVFSDAFFEPDETFSLRLTAIGAFLNGRDAAVCTIVDDDLPDQDHRRSVRH